MVAITIKISVVVEANKIMVQSKCPTSAEQGSLCMNVTSDFECPGGPNFDARTCAIVWI
jgi:hypothetical protein